MQQGTVISVNTGQVRPVHIAGRRIATALFKQPVDHAVSVGPLGLAGDEQADPTVHGGVSKAVYALPAEHYPYWQAQRAQSLPGLLDDRLPWGALGENLTLSGLTESELWVGDRLVFHAAAPAPSGAPAAPACELVVTEPRLPCFKFNAAMGWPQAGRSMVHSGRCGWYLSVARGGVVQAGMVFAVVAGPRQLPVLALLRVRAARAAV